MRYPHSTRFSSPQSHRWPVRGHRGCVRRQSRSSCMRALWLSLLWGACGSVHASLPDSGAAPDADTEAPDGGAVDASVPPVDASPCVEGGFVRLCLTELPTGPFTVVTSLQLDVDRDSRCASFTPSNPAWCVISGTRITVAAGVTLSGISTIHRRALVLIATEVIQIDGTLDVASHIVNTRMHVQGAGAQATECVNPSGAVWPGGGAGGSFRSRGGNGGTALNMGAAGIAAAATTALDKLRGGCAGGSGGPSDPNPGGQGGEGG